MIQDWKQDGKDRWYFLKGPGRVATDAVTDNQVRWMAVWDGETIGLFWDKLQPPLALQMAMGCVERRWQAEQAAQQIAEAGGEVDDPFGVLKGRK